MSAIPLRCVPRLSEVRKNVTRHMIFRIIFALSAAIVCIVCSTPSYGTDYRIAFHNFSQREAFDRFYHCRR